MKLRIFILLLTFSSFSFAVDYTNVIVTGYGLSRHDSDTIRFTIDKDPNVVILTRNFTGEQHKTIISMVIAAYASKAPVAFLRTSDASSASTKHYTQLEIFEVGEIQHD
jgi:hypothetical protein